MIVRAHRLSKWYNKGAKIKILEEITFSLKQGESMAIVGPSGVGKSTLLHIIGTLEAPSSGSLEILGKNVANSDRSAIRNRHIGFVFQNFNLLEESSILDNVLMPAKIGRQNIGKGSHVLNHIEELLGMVDLFKQRHVRVKHLSGGEKQRVAIARAFCRHPDLILADEPSGNLDENNALLVHKLLIGAVRDLTRSLIVVTHNKELAKLCDQQYLLTGGILTSI